MLSRSPRVAVANPASVKDENSIILASSEQLGYKGQFMDYLLKTEPTVYSFADLEREQSTIWDGVTNPAAVKHLREMKPGDRLVIYETSDHKSAVGTASVVSVDGVDPLAETVS
jgi:EVE domain